MAMTEDLALSPSTVDFYCSSGLGLNAKVKGHSTIVNVTNKVPSSDLSHAWFHLTTIGFRISEKSNVTISIANVTLN